MNGNIAIWLLKTEAVCLRPHNPFTWASGIRSPIYCDNRILLSYPKAREEVISAFCKLIQKKKIRYDLIAGIATAGIPWAAMLADRLKKPLIYVRSSPKGHGKGNQVEGCLKKGNRVLVIEDLVSTGGSSLAAIQAIRKGGGRVQDCLALFSYGFRISQEAFQKSHCSLYTLTDLSSLLKFAEEKKKITPSEKAIIERFILNPTSW